MARDGLSIGLNGGFEADTFKYGQKYAQIAIGNALIVGAANFWNSLDSSVTIEKVYVDTQQDVTINGVYGIATFENYPMILQNNVGEFKYIRPEHNSQAMVSIPVGGNMRYSWKFLLFRVGFTYDFIMSNTFKPVVNSFIWNDNATSFPAQAGGLLSGQNVFDMVLQNAADSGVAILPSTGGRDITIRQEITAQRVDAPVSIALQFINTYALKAYIGGGITYFWGKTTRVLQDTLPNTIADIDVYEGSTLGFHLLTGIEYEVLNRLGVSAELFFNYGIAGPLTDQVITEDPYTVRSFFHNPKTDRLGAEDRNNPEVSQLEFTGVRILLGVNYYVLQ
ncbi:MAG: hypothetical protein D6767_10010 [Candidatus Hydrogenedentota bacterium]|nr:MAG: hypothetical protein D6767_10010 [Candidatus Hydrogenedentota bacterium]